MRFAFVLALAVALLAAPAQADLASSLKPGAPGLKSAGALAFGPEGILFVGDAQQAAIFAIATGDTKGDPSKVKLEVKAINEQIASLLGTTAADILINDLAVNPASGNVFLSVSRGRGPDATPVILKLDASGSLAQVNLANVPFARAELINAPAPGGTGKTNARSQAITDIAFVDGRVIVAGLSNEEFASNLRAIPFPFKETDRGTSVEIYHGAHGAFETRSPVRTFTSLDIAGQQHLLAGYTCTPLVKFPVADLKPGTKVRGTTVAELGNRNSPLDMITYKQGGKDYLLIANTTRGIMKVSMDNVEKIEGITSKINGTAGLAYETIDAWKGVTQLDKLNDQNAVLLVVNESGAADLKTVALP
jgi:hypothetical protein